MGQKDGAIPPDHTIEKDDDVLEDTERLIKTYHDPAYGAMLRIENAPSSLFAVTERLWRESIALARKYGVGNHTHMAEAPDEERYVLEKFGHALGGASGGVGLGGSRRVVRPCHDA